MEFSFSRISFTICATKAVKGQILADFLADHPCDDMPKEAQYVALVPWKFYFDGSRAEQRAGVGIILESRQGVKT